MNSQHLKHELKYLFIKILSVLRKKYVQFQALVADSQHLLHKEKSRRRVVHFKQFLMRYPTTVACGRVTLFSLFGLKLE